jgi:hypothetical protein
MKILETVKEVGTTSNKYAELWETVRSLTNGDWLQVECENKDERDHIYSAAHMAKVSVKRRKLII